METGLDFDAIRREMDREEWSEREDGEDGQTRSVYLGSVFSLTPSGKYYLPFACSNVEACPNCGGRGSRRSGVPRRIARKYRAGSRAHLRAIKRMRAAGADCTFPPLDRIMRLRDRFPLTIACEACGGVGSREAYLDEMWNETVEEELSARGLSLESGEGDPCDLFATEYRDIDE